MFKAAIRVNKIKTIAQLRGATLHAQRHDEIGRARVREGAVPGTALAWSKADTDRDYHAAFRAHRDGLTAKVAKKTAVCNMPTQHVRDLHGYPNILEHLCVWDLY